LSPLYGWFATRVDRAKLLVGVTLSSSSHRAFASAVAARVPFVGVAFFIWVGIFNVAGGAVLVVRQRHPLKEAGDRLFPVIVIG
jgi:AAA family ATP:ADP antiporter